MIPRMLQPEQRWPILLRSVHQLCIVSLLHYQTLLLTYEEPHARTETCRRESVQWALCVDLFDDVLALPHGLRHSDECCLLLVGLSIRALLHLLCLMPGCGGIT
jgi:hypothetical protein